MIIKILKKRVNAEDYFPTINHFVNHIVTIFENLSNENIVKEYERLYEKIKNDDGEISISLLINWLRKNQKFKTKNQLKMEYWLERGWNEDTSMKMVEEKTISFKERNRLSIEYWLKKGHTKEEAQLEISKSQSNSSKKVKNRKSISKEDMRKIGMSENEIINFYSSRSHFSKKYWLNKGYSEEESILMVSKLQQNNSNNFASKRELNPEKYYKSTVTRIDYWINLGYSPEEAEEKLRDRQRTFTLDKCIEKYGKYIGEKVYIERQVKWNKSLTQNGNLKLGFSKSSQDLFYKIIENYDFNNHKNIFFATKNNEFLIKTKTSIWLYDYADLDKMKIIEYNGDSYHANPKIYNENDFPHPFRKTIQAKEIWEKDKQKIKVANENGFDVFVIWDSEYRKNKNQILQKCLNFLNQ